MENGKWKKMRAVPLAFYFRRRLDFKLSHFSFCSPSSWLGSVSTGTPFCAQNWRQRIKRRSNCPVSSEITLSTGSSSSFFPLAMSHPSCFLMASVTGFQGIIFMHTGALAVRGIVAFSPGLSPVTSGHSPRKPFKTVSGSAGLDHRAEARCE